MNIARLRGNSSKTLINENRAEKIARNENPLALVSTAQHYPNDTYYHAPKPHKNLNTSSRHKSSYNYHASTRNKGKEIAKPITHVSQSASEEDSDLEQAQRDKDMQKSITLTAKYFPKIYKPTNNNLRTSSNSINKNVDSTPRIKNDRQTVQETKAGKRLFLPQGEDDVVQAGREREHSEQPESINDTYVVEPDSNIIPDSFDMCNNEFEDDQNADDHDEDEHVELASLIANLKLDIDKNKKIQKQLRIDVEVPFIRKRLSFPNKECERLEIELSKQTKTVSREDYHKLVKRFCKLEQYSIALELALQDNQAELKNEKVWKQQESTSFRELNEKYFKIQYLKAQLQDRNIAISELKKLIEKSKG
ncbi:hypothetical protein Tco_0364001 [Tanacetum coccineum]